MDEVRVVDSIKSFMSETATSTDAVVYAKSYDSSSTYPAGGLRGGGLLRRLNLGAGETLDPDRVMIFKRSESSPSYWTRDLDGGTTDAYMAGTIGDGVLNADGTFGGTDDTDALQRLLTYYRNSARQYEQSAATSIRIGDGVFLVKSTLKLTSFKFSARGWHIDGTGATLLGEVDNRPVVDFTDSRFGTLGFLQVIGSSITRPSCGVRIGRIADNTAANQMTMDHLGIRGHYGIAALLNIASEQHTSINCEYYNSAEGSVYGYFADAFNCAQWGKPVKIANWSGPANQKYTITTDGAHGLTNNDVILVRSGNATIDAALHIVTVVNSTSFTIPDGGATGTPTGGQLYKQLYPDVNTPGLTPWTQASMKQQLHLNCRYGAPKGIAAIFEGTDSMHVYQACHPTSGFYAVDGTERTIQSIVPGTTTPGTEVTTTTPHGLNDNMLVSLTQIGKTASGNVPTNFSTFAGDRLFLVTVTSATSFRLRDLDGAPVISTGWGRLFSTRRSPPPRRKLRNGSHHAHLSPARGHAGSVTFV